MMVHLHASPAITPGSSELGLERLARARGKTPRAALVCDAMTTHVHTCAPSDVLASAARLMWDHDCGSVPVVDEGERVLGMLTDRDVCMAALTQGRTLAESWVSSAMSHPVATCSPDDRLEVALDRMVQHQVLRLPVTNWGGRLVGILSLSDVLRHARSHPTPRCSPEHVAAALQAILRPR